MINSYWDMLWICFIKFGIPAIIFIIFAWMIVNFILKEYNKIKV